MNFPVTTQGSGVPGQRSFNVVAGAAAAPAVFVVTPAANASSASAIGQSRTWPAAFIFAVAQVSPAVVAPDAVPA
jgi:hypothetical protein